VPPVDSKFSVQSLKEALKSMELSEKSSTPFSQITPMTSKEGLNQKKDSAENIQKIASKPQSMVAIHELEQSLNDTYKITSIDNTSRSPSKRSSLEKLPTKAASVEKTSTKAASLAKLSQKIASVEKLPSKKPSVNQMTSKLPSKNPSMESVKPFVETSRTERSRLLKAGFEMSNALSGEPLLDMELEFNDLYKTNQLMFEFFGISLADRGKTRKN
jgi:hypothetical protein